MPISIKKIMKHNINSEIYILIYNEFRVILRSCPSKNEKLLVQQVNSFVKNKYNKLEFLLNENNSYILRDDNLCWIGYYFVNGSQLNGTFSSISSGLEIGLKFNSDLNQVQK